MSPGRPRESPALSTLDVGDAYRRALVSDSHGPYNLAADPPLGPPELAQILHARRMRIPAAALRAGAAVTYRLRLQPSEPGWVDMALAVPLMDSSRARAELGWEPRYSATESLDELLAGMRAGGDADTPPLSRQTSGPWRIRELLGRVGGRP